MRHISRSITTEIPANICVKEQPTLEQAFIKACISSFLATLLLTIFTIVVKHCINSNSKLSIFQSDLLCGYWIALYRYTLICFKLHVDIQQWTMSNSFGTPLVHSRFSSPEHKVLSVSYCGQPMSVVCRLSYVINNLFWKTTPPTPLSKLTGNLVRSVWVTFRTKNS